ncbi:Uncharacterized protein BP5553_06391 [Venustampulla echinocandica]|uniref:P-loop containing nucleoside triphosphate hydrolase n=1 Tax=Venustampulla echinocandica TaxID=2656787 RepID=A0A370TJU5_9HELO|nr:Uncharacterized protein BP5553_06391 [Venustampulla echinocandica]RDL35779.1 Uncharacterized protein BP5553_06391 [Venustampulla echinocandica]
MSSALQHVGSHGHTTTLSCNRTDKFTLKGELIQFNQEFDDLDSDPAEVAWILNVVEFSRSGCLQGIILLASIGWLPYRIGKLPIITLDPRTRLSYNGWSYELSSQVTRAAALLFLTVSYVEGHVHLLSFAAITYAQILGLFRLVDDIHWHHGVLHPVNFVTTSMLLVLTAAHLLPCIQISTSQCTPDVGILGGISSLAAAVFVASITPREWVPFKVDPRVGTHTTQQAPAPEESCSWFTYYCTYGWFTPLIWKGVTKKLDMNSLPALAWYDEPQHLLGKIQKARAISKTTFGTVIRFQRNELMSMSLWIGASSCLEYIAPFAMFKLLQHIAEPTAATYHPQIWLVLLSFGPIAHSVSFQQYLFISTRLVVRIKSAMTQEIYHKAFDSMEPDEDPFSVSGNTNNANKTSAKQPQAAQQSTSTGRLANLMATDIDAISAARDIIIAIVGVPIGTAICLAGLYTMMGWVSIIGVIVILLVTPLSILLGKIMYALQKRVRQAQDGRISLITEYISSIRAIKLLALEDAMINKVDTTRAIEQSGLWRVTLLQAIINLMTEALPYIGMMFMFGLYVGLEQNHLYASTAFTSIILVKNIRKNAKSATENSRKFTGAIMAFKRLDVYFGSTTPLTRHSIGHLKIQNASFRRKATSTFRLKDISLNFANGGLNVITGQSGSGKTTLLLSMLGETHMESGAVLAPRDISFAPQFPWLQSGTIQENVLFHNVKDKVRYDRVLAACCLDIDLKKMSNGDMTMIGQNGTPLSGGQVARVALARALYSNSSLLLLDDIFSALDTRTSAEVWKYCFCSTLLDNRTTILVTQVPWIISQANLAIKLEKGRVKSVDTDITAIRRPITIYERIETARSSEKQQVVTPESNFKSHRGPQNRPSPVADDFAKETVHQEMRASRKPGRLARKKYSKLYRFYSLSSPYLTVFQYMRYFDNPILIAACMILSLLSHGSFFLSSYWMSIWVQAYEREPHVDTAYYMGCYAFLIFLGTVTIGTTIVAFEWGGWRASLNLHNAFIRAVMSAPLSWHKVVPLGRITNRFSRDISSIDKSLSSNFRSTLSAILVLLFRITGVSSLLPIFILPVVCASAIAVTVGEMYARTAVILRRLMSAAHSPLFSHFISTLAGLQVIRAQDGVREALTEDLATKLRVWAVAAEANYNCNRWVALRVTLMTALISMLAGFIAISDLDVISAGLVGFSLQNAVGLSQGVMVLVRAMNDLEIEMQSFHRVKEYIELEQESKGDESCEDEMDFGEGHRLVNRREGIPESWPQSGEIEFRNVTIRYEPDSPNVLTDINLRFKAGTRVAIVGRTGSGKTTVLMSLLRFTNIISGHILYDGIDITNISRRRLRESVTVVPQEPTLFSGSVRSNLDPTSSVSRDNIENALDSFKDLGVLPLHESSGQLLVDHSHMRCQGLSLSTEVTSGGENFSHGQRQVLSLCRAILRKNKLMLLDEATASMDHQADQGVQKILSRELKMMGDTTLVTVAHRLRTIVDYDTIVVMDAGKVIECGSPQGLYDAGGQFHNMVLHSGESTELQKMLKGSQ